MLASSAWRGVLLAAVLLPLAECFLRAPALPGAQARIDYQAQPRHRAAGARRHLCMRFLGDVRYPAPDEQRALPGDEHALSRKDFLLALAVGSASLLAPGSAAAAAKAAPVVVIGAAGLTGGNTVRALLRAQMPVVAATRRPVAVVSREKAAPGARVSKDTLVIDAARDEKMLKRVLADALVPETLSAALEGAQAVIFCAGSRPRVPVTVTPGTNPGGASSGPDTVEQGSVRQSSAAYTKTYLAQGSDAEPAADASIEDVGLVNVAKECLRLGIPRLVVVSSVCAKCQGEKADDGEQLDRGTASCDTCYRKQAGETVVRDLYVSAPKGVSYSIVRPGLLSNGEKRGVESVEMNQGITKSGIISREDLAELLVAAAMSDGAARKTFEVYYSDTAQPVDMYASLLSCKESGRSVKECFFGEGFDEKSPVRLEDVLKRPLKGSLFAGGSEVQGRSYAEMFSRLQGDAEKPFDINSLASPSIM
jgi:nucleoside-diphosphate-sugar epimerase